MERRSRTRRSVSEYFISAAMMASSVAAADEVNSDLKDTRIAHAGLFAEGAFPTAQQCGKCHPTHYREWSVSQHAYAMVSPVFNTMHAKLLKETNGTLGDFCIRCHTPVGMTMKEPLVTEYAARSQVSREGVTCIACHRVSQPYGKVSGRRNVEPGPVTVPVKGPTGNSRTIYEKIEEGDVTNNPDERGRKIHDGAHRFFQMVDAEFCASCHDVNGPNGLRLEEAFSHFKASPAAARGVSCQDCHMGKTPGAFSGDDKTNYRWGPAARVSGEWTKPRKLTNHMIVGPDYSIVHPALFPHTRNAIKDEKNRFGLATINDWLKFDVDAGWGSPSFEENVASFTFPEPWTDPEDRKDARKLLDTNIGLLERARQDRLTLLRNGYHLGLLRLDVNDRHGLEFSIEISNGTTGHPVPTGFDAERVVWLHIQVKDRDGRLAFESGDLDPNGDLRNLHSAYVHHGELPLDRQLVNLQGKFITRNIRGGEQERILAVNYSFSPLPFVRPPRRSNLLIGEPYGVRKHRQSISPGGSRWAHYQVEASALTGNGPYTITAALRAGMVPVNLITAIKDVGFDFGLSPREVADRVVEGYETLWERSMEVTR